jgi:hypothetical protein
VIRDFNIEWLEKRIFIPSGIGPLAEVTTPTVLRTWTSATSVTAQVASSGITKLAVSGASTDGMAVLMLAPYDLDIKHKIRFRAHYTSTATTGTVTWAVTYNALQGFSAGTAGATVIAAAATALDTVIPAESGTTVASDYRITGFGEIARGKIADTTDALIIQILCSDASPIAGLGLLGLEMRYTPRRTGGPRRNIIGGRRLVTGRPLGVQLATAQEGL